MKWISVKDRLPEFDDKGWSLDNVIAVDSGGIILIGAFIQKGFLDFFDIGGNVHGDITHWMPLPEPPEDT